jgi:branched-chain amino acid transport system permease protein
MRRAIPAVTKLVAFGAGVAVLLVLPHWRSSFETVELATVGVYFIAVLGLNVLTGYTGQVSLGHGAFMALGGYTTAILVAKHGIKDLWTIPLAGLVAGAAGIVFGIPALRLRGAYLALATFALPVVLPFIIKKFDHFTGGSRGLQFFGNEHYTGKGFQDVHVLGRALSFNDWLYYLCWTIAVVLFVAAWALLQGKVGRGFRAIRDSEVTAVSSGINASLYKAGAFGISAFYAGVAGSLLAIVDFSVSPSTFPLVLSLYLVIGAVVAGLGSLVGLAAGALFIQYLPDLAQHVSKSPGAPSVIYGVVLIAVVLLLPTGVGGLVRKVAAPLTNRASRGS